jgi:putative acyl-CoA dehydrogenase
LAHDTGMPVDKMEAPNENHARSFVERLAILASAAALQASAPPAIAEAFLKSRLAHRHSATYGTSDLGESIVELLLQRVMPEA